LNVGIQFFGYGNVIESIFLLLIFLIDVSVSAWYSLLSVVPLVAFYFFIRMMKRGGS